MTLCTIARVWFVLLLAYSIARGAEQPAECSDVASCRQAALAAAEQKNFEVFHDLAWRAIQKGRPNDPDLMLLLARAQSLSGRPGDALVMLRRLAAVGDASAALAGDDFQRVRSLPGWPDVETLIRASRDTGNAAAAASSRKPEASPDPRAAKPTRPEKRETKREEPGSPPKAAPDKSAAEAVAPDAGRARASSGEGAIPLSEPALDPIGLAYDQVSRRFVIGDRFLNRLIVADEIYKHVNDLIGRGSGGFGTLTALEIDKRRGDLWVTSAGDNGAATIHRLQLVSGRVLARLDVPEDYQPATFSDIAVSETGTVLLVDRSGSRLLTVAASGQSIARALPLELPQPTSLAVAGELVYVAHTDGLAIIDLSSRRVASVRPSKGVTLAGLSRIRWHRGGLIAIQRADREVVRLVRIHLGRSGVLASRIEILDDSVVADGSVLTIAGKNAWYLTNTGSERTIRRVPLE